MHMPSSTGLRDLSSRLTKSPSTLSYAFQTMELDTADLHCFVKYVLSKHVVNKECPVFQNLQDKVRHLLELVQKNQDDQLDKNSPQEQQETCASTRGAPNCLLDEIVLSLQSVIQSTPSLPPGMTAQVHSMIGLLRQKKGCLKGAIMSFLRALWIQSHFTTADSNSVAMRILEIGITRHRLGMAYGHNGNFADAMILLKTATQDYEQHQQARPSGDCHFVLSRSQKRLLEQVKVDLDTFTEARMLGQAHLARKTVSPTGQRFPFKSLASAPVCNNTHTSGGGATPTLERRPAMALAA